MNSMRFNEDKFQLLQIGPHNELKQPYTSNNIQIEKSTHVKDLGIYLSEDMSCKYHISQMTESASNFASCLLHTFTHYAPAAENIPCSPLRILLTDMESNKIIRD